MRVRPEPASFVLLLMIGAAACTETEAEEDTGQSATNPADEGASTGDDEPHVTMLAEVSNTVCDEVGVVGVQIEAVQVGCEYPPPAPCTMPSDPPPEVGDMVSCPITDPEVTLGVRVDFAAVYQVSVVADRTPDEPSSECYAESPTRTSVLVTTIDLDVHAQKMLIGLGSECPPA